MAGEDWGKIPVETKAPGMTEPTDKRNVLELPDEGLGAIRVLFDELHARIERTVVNEESKAIALQHLRTARTHCVIGADRQA